MATTQEAIARLRMIFETQGADAAVAEMKKLETAETSLGTSSLNLDRSFANLERRYSETARATAEYERSMRTLNAAVAQNPALAERAAAVQQTIAARYQATVQAAHQAAASQTALGQVNQAMQAQMQGLAGSTGLVGSALSVMGRGGLAVATGIGAAVLAFHALNDAANNMARYATDVKRFAEATGLTTAQVQGLNKEASKFGVDTESLQRFVMRFTSGFEEMRSGAGGLFEAIRKVDAGLAEQMRSSEDETEALQKLITAIQTADTVWQKAALARAAGAGKGAAALVPFLSQLDVGGLTAGRRGLSAELIEDLDKGRVAVEEASRAMAVAWNKNWAVAFLETKRQLFEMAKDLLNMSKREQIGLAVGGPIGLAIASIPTTRASDVEALKVFEEQEQILKKRLEEIEAAAAAMGDQSSRQFRKLVADAGKLREQLEEVQKEKAKIAQTPVAEGTASTVARPAGPTAAAPTLGQMKSDDIVAASNRYKELQGVLGGLIPVAQQVEEALRQIELAMRAATTAEYKAQIAAAKDELIALKTVQAEMSQVEPGTYQRQGAQIKAVKAEYPGLVAQDAIRMKHLDDQLRIAQAMPGIARMEAEEQARINQLRAEGKSLELAITIAAKERAVVQAQIDSAAQLQLQQLREQYEAVVAVTGAERMKAQAAATYAQLVRQGVSATIAQAIAAQEVANAIASANANASRQVVSLNESTALIRAQTADLQEQEGWEQKILGANEINVRVQQAYTQAIREGADAEHALAAAAATLNNLLAQREMQIERINQQKDKEAAAYFAAVEAYRQAAAAAVEAEMATQHAAQAAEDLALAMHNAAANAEAWAEQLSAGAMVMPSTGGGGGGSSQWYSELTQAATAGSVIADSFLRSIKGNELAVATSASLPSIFKAIEAEQRYAPIKKRQEEAQDQLTSLQNQYLLGAAPSPEAKAQLQSRLTYEQLIKEGVRADLATQIANQELQNAMQDLAKSVDANTTALQDQLDPIYTEGRAALRIGYYGEGSGGTMRTVTGTGFAGTPANMNVPAVPAAPSVSQPSTPFASPTVVINNNFAAGAVMGDRRTQYQAANSYGRAVRAMT